MDTLDHIFGNGSHAMDIGKAKYWVRWMVRRDMEQVLSIENASFEFPWPEGDFLRCLKQRNAIGMVANPMDTKGVDSSRVLGFMIYELHKTRLHVLNFAVHPNHRRAGVGTAMVDKLTGKLSAYRRNKILLEIREKNLPGQLFFRHVGFRAVSVLHDFYEDTTEDAYLMQWRLTHEHGIHHPSSVPQLRP